MTCRIICKIIVWDTLPGIFGVVACVDESSSECDVVEGAIVGCKETMFVAFGVTAGVGFSSIKWLVVEGAIFGSKETVFAAFVVLVSVQAVIVAGVQKLNFF